MIDTKAFGSMSYQEWLQAILSVIADFADKEYQKRVWIEGTGPEVSSYEEAVNSLQDYAFDTFINYSRYNELLTSMAIHDLEEFNRKLDTFDLSVKEMFARSEHFATPQWEQVTASAQRALDSLRRLQPHDNT